MGAQPTQLQLRSWQPEIRRHVEGGSNLYTDKWVAYKHLDQDYIHGVINHAEKYVDGQIHTNSIENFWSLRLDQRSELPIHWH